MKPSRKLLRATPILAAIALALLIVSQSYSEASAASRAYLPLAIVSTSTAISPTPTSTPSPVFAAAQTFTLDLHNQTRIANGLPLLVLDDRVTAAAQGHADDMARRGYFSHDSPEGKTPWDRLSDAGAPYRYAGENIGYGTIGGGGDEAVIQRLFTMMMAETPPDDGHRQNILGVHYRKLGVGVGHDGSGHLYWVCDFTD